VDGERLVANGFAVALDGQRPAGLADAREVVVGIRPENVGVAPRDARGPAAPVSAVVDLVEPLGHQLVVHATAGDARFVTSVDPHTAVAGGATIQLLLELEKLHFFDAKSEERIG
jgi:multiple sugar transport system ATP-binding protein